MNQQELLKALKSIPRDAVDFDHPALNQLGDSAKNYIIGMLVIFYSPEVASLLF